MDGTTRNLNGATVVTPTGWVHRRLGMALSALIFVCPNCRHRQAVAPPFDLLHFACTACRQVCHPFVEKNGQIVDLRFMREILIGCYHSTEFASGVLVQTSRIDRRGQPWDLQIPREVAIIHAMAAYARHRRVHLPWWAVLGSLAMPFSHVLVQRHAAEQLREELVRTIKTGSLSLVAFDPRVALSPEHIADCEPRMALFWSSGDAPRGGPRILHVDRDASNIGGLGTLAASWNLAIDRARTRGDKAGGSGRPVVVDDDEFGACVVERARSALGHTPTLRCDLREVVFCRGDLADQALGDHRPLDARGFPMPGWTPEQRKHIAGRYGIKKADMHPVQMLESSDYRTGLIYSTCLSVSSLAHLTSIRWRTFRWGPADGGILNGAGKEYAPERSLCAEEVATANRWWPPLLSHALLLLFGAVVALVAIVDGHSTLASYAEMAYLLSFGSALWMALHWRSQRDFLLPESLIVANHKALGAPGMLKKWTERQRQRDIQASWRQGDPSAFAGIAAYYAPVGAQRGFLGDEIAFAVHAQNKIILDAIIAEAESRGIDMKEFKEYVLEINNFGVIAKEIHGPVATGNQAQAFGPEQPAGPAPGTNSGGKNHDRASTQGSRAS